MKTLVIAEHPLEPSTYVRHHTDDVTACLRAHFGDHLPAQARIFHERVAASREVTPIDDAGIRGLEALDGTIIVVVYPEGPALVAQLFLTALLSTFSYLLSLKPATTPTPIPLAAQRNVQAASPNNELSARANQMRLGARIPDIVGEVWSTPDDIMVPYRVFVDHQEVEIAFMCVGRGSYVISDPKDGDTPITDIEKAAVAVYAPNTSPNSGHAPQFSVGDAINRPVSSIARLAGVNGQVLLPSNANGIIGNSDVRFYTGGFQTSNPNVIMTEYFKTGEAIVIQAASVTNAAIRGPRSDFDATFSVSGHNIRNVDVGWDLTTMFSPGVPVVVQSTTFTDGIDTHNLNGTYQVEEVGPTSLKLVNPAAVNAAWSLLVPTNLGDIISQVTVTADLVALNLDGTYVVASVSANAVTLVNPHLVNGQWSELWRYGQGFSNYVSPLIYPSASNWVGPFRLPDPALNKIILNLVALNGLYRDNGSVQTRHDISVYVETTALDVNGNAAGAASVTAHQIDGSSAFRTTRARTVEVTVAPSPGGYRVRVRRDTLYDYNFVGQTVDEVRWRDCYSSSPIGVSHFGNVTTIQSQTQATPGALAVKERKLTVKATRKLPAVTRGLDGKVNGFTTDLTATTNAADILCALSLDPFIGRRDISELGLDNIYDTLGPAGAVQTYFGTDDATKFSYTFDKQNFSFEDTFAAVADAVFCSAYRRGHQLQVWFERATDTGTILFNGRNTLPGTEMRTTSFGTGGTEGQSFDGVSYKYTSPDDGAIITYYIPPDRSAIVPEEVESIGVATEFQAYVHAHRLRNRHLYQHTVVDFEATAEARLLVKNQRIIKTDNTRPGSLEGEVVAQDVLELTLSNQAELDPEKDWTIFLQLVDGTIDAIPVSGGSNAYSVVLDRPPAQELSLDPDNFARTTYHIEANDAPRASAFLVVERTPKDKRTANVKAVNYDARFYQHDLTFPD